MNQDEIIQQVINTILIKFSKGGNNIFWNDRGCLNVRELYNMLLGQRGFDTHKFKASSEFESYIKFNIRKFGLLGKLYLSHKTNADKFANAEETIEKFNHALVQGEPSDTDFMVRTKLGNGRIRAYSGSILTRHEINMLKTAYRLVEGVKYIDVRPCLYKNWKNWSDERQQASSARDIRFER